jgi:alpha-beta hydrolase superfamily lysophospholipase
MAPDAATAPAPPRGDAAPPAPAPAAAATSAPAAAAPAPPRSDAAPPPAHAAAVADAPTSGHPAPADGGPRTPSDDADPARFLGPRGAARRLTNAAGLRLSVYFWPAAKPRATLQFVHGHGCHALFELLAAPHAPGELPSFAGSWVEALNATNISIAALDAQSCGRSQGARGLRSFVERFDDLVADQLLLAAALAGEPAAASRLDAAPPRGLAPPLPAFLAGISLGGCVALTAALEAPARFAGLTLFAPMLSLEKSKRRGLNPYLHPLATLLNYVVPTWRLVAIDRNTKFPETQARWDADALCAQGASRVRSAVEFMAATDRAQARFAEAALPLLVFHSEGDTMCDADGSKALYLASKSTDKTLRLVNDMWHLLLKEEGHEAVRAEFIAWVLKRAPPTA